MEALQTTATESSPQSEQPFHLVANSLARLLETARRELQHNQEAARASLNTASRILQDGDGPCWKAGPWTGNEGFSGPATIFS